jgi:isocitrate lyase
MGAGSTQTQHLVQTEVPPKLLAAWLAEWADHHGLAAPAVSLRPHTAGSEVLELSAADADGEQLAHVVFSTITDRRGRSILSVRDQSTAPALRRKRLMTLLQLFLLHRYRVASVHYVTPTEDNRVQCERLRARGLFETVSEEIGQIIVAEVSHRRVAELVAEDGRARRSLIAEA